MTRLTTIRDWLVFALVAALMASCMDPVPALLL